MIRFNKPYTTGKEIKYIQDAIERGKLSGNKEYTKKSQEFFENKYNFKNCLLTTSCTDALEMISILANIEPGDEIIMPSYTFVSTANAFVLRGAKIVFADSQKSNPNIDSSKIEHLITQRTKAVVVVHYAGVACEMDTIKELCKKHNLFLIEDAAQAIDSFYKGKPLGSIGDFSAFSFHETKNIISGEGGMLVTNETEFIKRAEIIWEKGTNRSSFYRGEIDKYGWVDMGSSFLPSELNAAFLYAQLEELENIQASRIHLWNLYKENLSDLIEQEKIKGPDIPKYASNNAHMFYIVCNNIEEREGLINYLKSHDIHAVFHYLSLHKSNFYKDKHDGRKLIHCDNFADHLLRLPLHLYLSDEDIVKTCNLVREYYDTI